jgi:hypothetical protein
MKVEKNVLAVLVLFLIVISGCQKNPEMNQNVYKGTNGLVVEVLKNSPPTEVYEEESFKIVARLINKGAYPITNGIFLLTLEKDFIDLQGSEINQFGLDGKNAFNAWNDEVIKSYDLTAKRLDSLSEKHESIMLLTACYDYETLASFDICIDTNPYNKKSTSDPVCQVKQLTSAGQGSPVVVTIVEQDISEETNYVRPMFDIYIENKGKGDVTAPGSQGLICSSSPINEEKKDIYNMIDLKEVEFSNLKKSSGQIKCTPQLMKLENNKATARCTVNSGLISKNNPSYQTALKITLKYSYTETQTVYVDIKNDPGVEDDAETFGASIPGKTDSTETSEGTNYGVNCKTPYSQFDCYDLSNNAKCPTGFHDIVGYCPNLPNEIRCCIKYN